VVLTLPAGYRPANQRRFVTIAGGQTTARITISNNGSVTIDGVTNNAFLSLESVRFDAA
jgi:hypothetical protein